METLNYSNGPTPTKYRKSSLRRENTIPASILDEFPLFEKEDFNSDAFVDKKCCSLHEKGLRTLYGELIEQRRASTEEMRRSVYSNYSAFIRTSKEISELEGELNSMRNLLTLQADLIHKLAESAQASHSSSVSFSLKISVSKESDLLADLPDLNPAEVDASSMSDTLDSLIAERKVNEAIELLERGKTMIAKSKVKPTLNSQEMNKLEKENSVNKSSRQYIDNMSKEYTSVEEYVISEQIANSLSVSITEKRMNLVEMLSDFIRHPSVQGEELRNLIRQLDKLGESSLAHTLLLTAHCERLKTQVRSLRPSGTSYGNLYTSALTQLTFSTISQAVKDSAAIFSEKSSMASELVLWANEITEYCAELLQKHVLSSCNAVGGLNTAAECAKISLSYCQLLESNGLSLAPVLMKYLKPSVEEALQANIWRIEESVAAMTSAEDWSLNNLQQAGKSSKQFSSLGNNDIIKLSSSGQRFFLLLQDFVEDLTPVINFRLSNSILDNLAYLFESYCCMLLKALPEAVTEDEEEEEDEEGEGEVEEGEEGEGEGGEDDNDDDGFSKKRRDLNSKTEAEAEEEEEVEDEDPEVIIKGEEKGKRRGKGKGNDNGVENLNHNDEQLSASKSTKEEKNKIMINRTDSVTVSNVKVAIGEKQQLALLANASALADELLPRFALKINTLKEIHSSVSSVRGMTRKSGSFSELRRSTSSRANTEQSEWRRKLQKSVDKLRDSLCSSLVNDFVFDEEGKLLLTANEYLHTDVESDPYTWQNDPMPSNTFKALFMAIENTRGIAEDVLANREKVITLFLMRLAEWLLSGLLVYSQFWEDLENSELPISACGLQQLVFDMYFVMHIAQVGKYFSRGVKKVTYESMIRAIDLYKQQTGQDPGGFLQEDAWFKVRCEIACEKVRLLREQQFTMVDTVQEVSPEPVPEARYYRNSSRHH